MSVGLYMDVHVPGPLTAALRRRGVNVATAQEDGADQFADQRLLERSTELGRVLFTQDDDLLKIAANLQARGEHFAGVAYTHQVRVTAKEITEDLELIAKAMDIDDCANVVFHLPL